MKFLLSVAANYGQFAYFRKKLLLLTATENTITYHIALCLSPDIVHKHCLQFFLGILKAPRETEDNAYAKFWVCKQRAIWYVIVFSVVVN